MTVLKKRTAILFYIGMTAILAYRLVLFGINVVAKITGSIGLGSDLQLQDTGLVAWLTLTMTGPMAFIMAISVGVYVIYIIAIKKHTERLQSGTYLVLALAWSCFWIITDSISMIFGHPPWECLIIVCYALIIPAYIVYHREKIAEFHRRYAIYGVGYNPNNPHFQPKELQTGKEKKLRNKAGE